MGPLEGTSGILQPSISFNHNQSWFLQPQVMGTCLPSTGTLAWGAWGEGGIPCFSGENFTLEIFLYIFICYTWVRDLPILRSALPTSLNVTSSMYPYL